MITRGVYRFSYLQSLSVRQNKAFFRTNGSCGYVLKPLHVREPNSPEPRPLTLKLNILSGVQLF